ncbi:methyltransferase domain-containing protein [bacterium]|nr:methyltransferase domain-containing protein [bacterium]
MNVLIKDITTKTLGKTMDNKKDFWNAKYYKNNSQGQYQKGISTIEKIELSGNESVLDIGCGDGRITAEIAKQVPNGYVLGVDVSKNMIEEAIKSFASIKNLEFQLTDAAKFSTEKKFDLAVSFSAFHWIKDQVSTLKNIYNFLNNGGKLIIQMVAKHKSPIREVYEQKKWKNILKDKENKFFHKYANEFSAMLNECGFRNIKVNLVVMPKKFANKEELFNWAYAWIPHSTGLEEKMAIEFTNDVVEAVANSSKNGKLYIESHTLDIYAEK